MMWSVGPWELAMVLSKTLSYLGFAGLSGGLFVWWLVVWWLGASIQPTSSPPRSTPNPEAAPSWSLPVRRLLIRLWLIGSALGALAVILFFLLQVGVINQSGIAGMFDFTLIQVLGQSSVGHGAGLRLASFAMMGFVVLASRSALLSSAGGMPALLIAGWLLGTLLFASSFAILGHIAELGLLSRVAVMIHIAVIGLWIGALYPLHALVISEAPARVQPLLRIFGAAGWCIIAALLLSGITLVWQVLGTPRELIATPYGLHLLTKLVLVSSLLCLAALNKFRLVPALASGGKDSLRRSIKAEMALALFVLLVTAFMTTITGPAHLM